MLSVVILATNPPLLALATNLPLFRNKKFSGEGRKKNVAPFALKHPKTRFFAELLPPAGGNFWDLDTLATNPPCFATPENKGG